MGYYMYFTWFLATNKIYFGFAKRGEKKGVGHDYHLLPRKPINLKNH